MKQVLAFFLVLLALVSCSDKQLAEKSGNALDQYVDSITKVYPNYSGNIAVQKMIGEDFVNHLAKKPDVLSGTAFKLVNIGEVAGKTMVMFSCDHLYLWCEDYGTENAAKLDNTKAYRIAGGEFDMYEPVEGVAGQQLKLGSVFYRNLVMEEI